MSLDVKKDQIWVGGVGKGASVESLTEYHVKNALRMVIKHFNKKGIVDIHSYIKDYKYE